MSLDFNDFVTAASRAETDTTILKATARALAKMIEQSSLYAADGDIRMGVREVLRLTEPRR